MPSPTNQPAPQPDYNFILQDKPKRRLSLPKLNLPKPLLITLIVVVGLLLIITVWGLVNRKGSTNTVSLSDIAARQAEIVRVSNEAASDAQDPTVQNLATTASTALGSDQQQLDKYLGLKANDKSLNKYLNKNTDTQLQTATQNNNYDQVYLTYLQQSLQTYQQALQTVSTGASTSARALLQTDYNDAASLLAAPQFKNL